MDVWRVNTGSDGTVSYRAMGGTLAEVDDTVFIDGGSATNNFLQLTFDVDGSVSEFADFSTLDGFDPTVPGNFTEASGFAAVAYFGGDVRLSGPGTATINIPLAFGTDQTLRILFPTVASFGPLLQSQGFRVSADFSHTAVLPHAFILDQNRELLTGATLRSANGITYGTLGGPAVPEPPTLLLVASASAFLWRRKPSRWRRHYSVESGRE
jgi:hypothetical protein